MFGIDIDFDKWVALLEKGPYAFVVIVLLLIIGYLILEIRRQNKVIDQERGEAAADRDNANRDKDKLFTVVTELKSAIDQLNLLLRVALKIGDR